MHTLFAQQLDPTAPHLLIEGDEARHAVRVKRLQPGDLLRLLDGAGTVATARVEHTRGGLMLQIIDRRTEPPPSPALHAWTATPKGPRVEELVDALSQVGAASWTPMSTKLGVVDPRESKLGRLERLALEAAKQAQRPWLMRLEAKANFEDGLAPRPGTALVLADASGDPYRPTGATEVRLFIGPEGGWRPEEIDAARRAGAQIASFGPHVMRIEVAAPVAAAVVLNAERQGRS